MGMLLSFETTEWGNCSRYLFATQCFEVAGIKTEYKMFAPADKIGLNSIPPPLGRVPEKVDEHTDSLLLMLIRERSTLPPIIRLNQSPH
jgi:hypothetical protein